MSATLSEEHERELKKIFDDYDQNGSGDIDIDELRDIAEDLGEPLSEIELKYLTKEFDTDESGAISWTEFITWWKLPSRARGHQLSVDLHYFYKFNALFNDVCGIPRLQVQQYQSIQHLG